MKSKVSFLMLALALLVSCNPIPNKSITEKLDAKELASIIKTDTAFAQFYTSIQTSLIPQFEENELLKAKYIDVTYRRYYDFNNYLSDDAYWNPIDEDLRNQWNSKYGNITERVDSTIAYWNNYMNENSLDRFVKIEVSKFDIEYYSYIGGVSEAKIGFLITPLQGKIEQLTFDYSYGAKIYDVLPYTHSCIATTPVAKPTTLYWEIPYSEKEKFNGMTIAKFKRDYNVEIEIKSVRKDNVNYSCDLGLPQSVKNYLRYGKSLNEGQNIYEDDVIVECIDSQFIPLWRFLYEETGKIAKEKDAQCYELLLLSFDYDD